MQLGKHPICVVHGMHVAQDCPLQNAAHVAHAQHDTVAVLMLTGYNQGPTCYLQ